MKCPKCACEIFVMRVTAHDELDYFVTIGDDGSIEIQYDGHTYRGDTDYPNTAECNECGEVVNVPGQLSDAEQDMVRKRAKDQWEEDDLQIASDAKVEKVTGGFWIESRVWLDAWEWEEVK